MDQKGGLKYKIPDFVLDFWFGAECFRRIVGHSKMKSGSFKKCFFRPKAELTFGQYIKIAQV